MTITRVLAAIDASGSMYSVADDVRGGFNQYMRDLAADTDNEYRVTVYTFNSHVALLTENALPDDVPPLDRYNYSPGRNTALLDAIGTLVNGATPADSTDKVLVIIHTDGLENSSREWAYKAVADLIAAKKAEGWGFVFLGAGVDTWQQGEQLGMYSANTVNSRAGTRGTYEGMSGGTISFASGMTDAEGVTKTANKFSMYRDEEERSHGE